MKKRKENLEEREIRLELRCVVSEVVNQRTSEEVEVVLETEIYRGGSLTEGIEVTGEEQHQKEAVKRTRKMSGRGLAKTRGLFKNSKLQRRKMNEAFN